MRPKLSPAGLSLWLLPQPDDAKPWQASIDKLARRHETFPFQAHVTAATLALAQDGGAHHFRQAISALEAIAAMFGPITLPTSSPVTGSSFFQCVFCELPTAPIAAIGESFLGLTGPGELDPTESTIPTQVTQHAHMSLLYSDLPLAEREKIATTFTCPTGPMTLDTLCLVSPGERQPDFSDPQAWKIITHTRLTGHRQGP